MSKKSELKHDMLGNRMKMYEAATTSRIAYKGLPIVARLDGKSFSTFTKGLCKPYDERMSKLMVMTTKDLVDRFHASAGYTQSDEITLVWFIDSHSVSDYPFSGRIQKFESLLAASASAFFNKKLETMIPEKSHLMPIFDCRAFVVPSKTEAANAVLWRQQDCIKNAITMAASCYFSHSMLQNRSGVEKRQMLLDNHINFDDYPSFFKYGTFVCRTTKMIPLSDAQLARIPENKRPEPGALFSRTELVTSSFQLKDCVNKIAVLFDKETECPTH